MSKLFAFFFFNLLACAVFGQNLTLDGYVFESGNRGFLNVVQITVYDDKDEELGKTFSDLTGHFEITVPARFKYKVKAFKDMFEEIEQIVDVTADGDGDKIFMKMEMKRAEGYLFEITLAEKRDHDSIVVDAIKGARIEVYNNTKKEPVLELLEHPEPHFQVALQKGNHYTVLVRKDGYLGKRMEAFVDVEGCILCFEGLGSVTPGVTDNLSEGNKMGVLLANVELEKIYEGKTIPISNILYATGSAEFKKNDEDGLMQLATLMKDNPDLTVEIGSHTDSRGKQDLNMELSQNRAKNVVSFLVDKGVKRLRLLSRGYGETKLLNDCDSFTECSEREHRINRRTELKVIGIAYNKAPVKSLSQIKQMEQGEALLQEIQFGGQVQIPSDSIATEKPAVDTAVPAVKIEEGAKGEEEQMKMDKVVMEQVDKEEEITEQEAVQQEGNSLKNKISDKLAKKTEETDAVVHKEEADTEVIATPAVASSIRIVIKESEDVLSGDHEIFKLHSNVSHIKDSAGNHLYMIGEFAELPDAEQFNKTVKNAYSDCYIVRITAGEVTKL